MIFTVGSSVALVLVMKNYAILGLLFALGCHSGGQNGSARVIAQSDPAAIVSDSTLGCHKTFGEPTRETSYADMIDGKPGSYVLISSTAYFESQPEGNKNTNIVLQSYNVRTAKSKLVAEQSVPCYDYDKTDLSDVTAHYNLPLEINRADGKILSQAEFAIESQESGSQIQGSRSVSNVWTIKNVTTDMTDIKSLTVAKSPRHFKTLQFSRINKDEVHIVLTDKFVTRSGNKGIKIILGVYRIKSS
jgi:hypothetical protein